MKILLVMPFFYPHRGGSQKYAEDIYKEIMEQHPNVTVDVVTYNTDHVDSYQKYGKFNIYRVPCINILPARFTLPNPWALGKLLDKLKENKYDIVNTHIRFFDPTWWVWKYAKNIGAKSFFTGHVATHPVHQYRIVETIAKVVDLTIAKVSLKHYDIITYVSNTTKEFFENTLKVSKNKGHIIYGSIDTTKFFSKKEGIREIPNTQKKILGDKILVTYVGRVIWTKGITHLYEAIKQLKDTEEYNQSTFVIAGPGELEEKLKRDIKLDGLQEKVILTGNLNYKQVQKLLSITDIYINPSHHSEGFPITILEAGASECYVIATDNAGTKEIVKSGETGELIKQRNTMDMKNSIKWAVNNKEERTKIARNMQKKVRENFDIKITSEKLYRLLEKALK